MICRFHLISRVQSAHSLPKQVFVPLHKYAHFVIASIILCGPSVMLAVGDNENRKRFEPTPSHYNNCVSFISSVRGHKAS